MNTVTEIPIDLPFESGQNFEFLLLPNTTYTVVVTKTTSATWLNKFKGDSWYAAVFLMKPDTHDHVPLNSDPNTPATWSKMKVKTGYPETLNFTTPAYQVKMVLCVSSNLCASSTTSGLIRISGGAVERVHHIPYSPELDESGYRILCLDGGGTRGLIEVKMMQAIERKTKKKIWELFNLICGTSTGGIISLLVGIKRFPLKVIEELYLDLAYLIFGDIYSISKTGVLSAEWRSSRLKSLAKAFFGDIPLITTRSENLKVFTIATLANLSPLDAFLFRNYDSDDHLDGQACNAAIYEAALATSAAPTYFAPYTRNGNVKQTFIDGGLIANNPSEYALIEAKRLWPNLRLKLLLSLGTGVPSIKLESSPGLFSTLDFTLSTYTSSHNIHKRVLERMREYDMLDIYSRLSPDRGEGNYPLDLAEKEKLSQLSNSTDVYLAECERHKTRDFEVLHNHFQFELGGNSPKSGHARHLIVLLHGLFGSDNQLTNLRNYFNARVRDGLIFVPASNTSSLKSAFTTLDGVPEGGDRILLEIRKVLMQNPYLSHFSIIGNSLGGIYARYCIGELMKAPWFALQFHTFATICTPHLGVHNLLNPLKEQAFSWTITGFDLTGRSLFLKCLCSGEYFEALKKFQNRVLVGNLCYDHLVPFPTALLADYIPKSLNCKENTVEVLFSAENIREYQGTLMSAKEAAPLSEDQRECLNKLRELSWHEIHCYFKQVSWMEKNKHNTPAMIRSEDAPGVMAVERLIPFFSIE